MPTAGDADANIDVGKFVKADDEERFVNLLIVSEVFRKEGKEARKCTLKRRISG